MYDFAATWVTGSGMSTQVNYAVDDANYNKLGFAYINQTAAPNQFSDQGVEWNRLGTFSITTATVVHVIAVNGTSSGQFSADAVRITPVSAITLTTSAKGSKNFSTAGAWTTGSQGLYGSNARPVPAPWALGTASPS